LTVLAPIWTFFGSNFSFIIILPMLLHTFFFSLPQNKYQSFWKKKNNFYKFWNFVLLFFIFSCSFWGLIDWLPKSWRVDSQTLKFPPNSPIIGCQSPKPVSGFGIQIPNNLKKKMKPPEGEGVNSPKPTGFGGSANQKQLPKAGRESSRQLRVQSWHWSWGHTLSTEKSAYLLAFKSLHS
jgi:hypothetical protein